MFVDQKRADASLVREKGTNLYLMVKSNQHLPEKYEKVLKIENTPVALIDLLKMPRPLEEILGKVMTESGKAFEYAKEVDKEYRDRITKIIEKDMKI